MGPVEIISFLFALAGCFVGLAGWLSGRDKKIIGDAEWRGSINAKLDTVIGFGESIAQLNAKMDKNSERLAVLERDTKQAHKRIDDLVGKQTRE